MSDQYSNPFGSFIFGGTSDTPTYEELKRRRAIAAVLASRQRGFPKNIGEGLTYLGESIGEAVGDWRLRQQEEKLRGINQGLRGGPPPETGAARPPAPAPAQPAPKVAARPAVSPVLSGADPIASPTAFAPVSNLGTYSGEGDGDNVTMIEPGGPSVPPEADPALAAPAPQTAIEPQDVDPAVVQAVAEATAPPAPPPEAQRNQITMALLNRQSDAPQPGALPPLGLPAGAMDPNPVLPGGGQAPPVLPVTGGRRVLPPQGWAASDPRWQALDDDQKAAAMAMMEANSGAGAAQDRVNVLAAIHNRADADKTAVGSSVSRRIYQPVIEPSQQARLDRILADPAHAELTALSRQYGAGGERPHTATHFLAPEKTMLALEAREPGKYKSWRNWTGFDPESGQYSGVQLRDSSHAFLTPGGGGQAPAPAGPPIRMASVSPAEADPGAGDRLLSEVVGGGLPGLRGQGATAALGREGPTSDAPPIGSVGNIGAGNAGIDQSIEARRNAITGALLGRQEPPPPVPQTVAQAPGGVATDAGGGAGAAGASMFDPRPMRSMPPAAFAPTGAQQGISKAPAKLPSEEAIPPAAPLTAKQPGALEPPPTASKPGREETYWRNVMRHPSADAATQAYAKEQAEQYERSRLKADERAYEQWTNKRSVTQAEQTKYEESLRTAPREALEQHKVRLEIQKAQADARMQPDQALKLQKEIEAVDAQIQKTKQGIITPTPGPSAGYDMRLGTPQSPQRNRNPAPPPVPPGTAPEVWADQQSKSIKKDLDAVDAAEPEFRKMLETIDYVRKHPGKKLGTGPSSVVMPPNTDAYTFSGGKEGGLIGQLKGKNFLSGYAKLKGGGGQISNIEGEKTEQSQAALNPLAGEKAMDAALNAMEDSIRYDLEVAQRRTNRPVTAWQRTPNDPYAPDIGERKGNKEYIGGKPSDPNSWRDVR